MTCERRPDACRGRIVRTPVVTRGSLGRHHPALRVFFKCENVQRARAFKVRGALNRLLTLTPEERARGVIAFSSGNHAQGVALAARLVGTTALIVMPNDAPALKVEATRGYGAEIVVYDRLTEDREAIARRLAAAKRPRARCRRTTTKRIMAGQGTAALELLEDVPGCWMLSSLRSGAAA